MRRSILRHELSHAEFFSNPAYASYVRRFWSDLDAGTQAGFAGFLAASDYDPTVPDLYANEMQAFLMHTVDPRLFTPGAAVLSGEAFARLQAAFLLDMPPGWLRDCAPPPAGATLTRGVAPPRRRVLARRPSRRRRGLAPGELHRA